MSIGGVLRRRICSMLGWSAWSIDSEYVYPPVEIDGRSCTSVRPSKVNGVIRISVRIESQDCILIDRFLGPSAPINQYAGLPLTRGLYGVIHILDVPKSKTLFNRLKVVIEEFTPYHLRYGRGVWFLVENYTGLSSPITPGTSIEINGYPYV